MGNSKSSKVVVSAPPTDSRFEEYRSRCSALLGLESYLETRIKYPNCAGGIDYVKLDEALLREQWILQNSKGVINLKQELREIQLKIEALGETTPWTQEQLERTPRSNWPTVQEENDRYARIKDTVREALLNDVRQLRDKGFLDETDDPYLFDLAIFRSMQALREMITVGREREQRFKQWCASREEGAN